MKHSSGGKTEFLLPIFSEECAELIPPFVFVLVREMHVCVCGPGKMTLARNW